MHPELSRSLMTAHIEEIRRARSRCRTAPRPRTRALRRRSGWFLIEVGLRLANPAPHSAGLTP